MSAAFKSHAQWPVALSGGNGTVILTGGNLDCRSITPANHERNSVPLVMEGYGHLTSLSLVTWPDPVILQGIFKGLNSSNSSSTLVDSASGNYESAGGMSFLHPSDPFAPVGT